MSPILILGKNGFLGSSLFSIFKSMDLNVHALTSAEYNFSKPDKIFLSSFIQDHKIKIVIITVAISDIEKCYKEQSLSYQINVTGTIETLEAIKECQAIPIFFSSDYVFATRTSAASETDVKKPSTIYGQQKFEVEKYIQYHFKQHLIFRTNKLISKSDHSKNILSQTKNQIQNGQKLQLFEDQYINPVFVEDIADLILKILKKHPHASGDYNLGTKKIYTRLQLAHEIARHFKLSTATLQPISIKNGPFSEERPNYHLLNCSKAEKDFAFVFTEISDLLP